ncbi:uncharacterized protein LOC34620040 [Cyclospora cayetanensis]|uniref:Uncharacterized protein LOC34620040 n=1 Tax=Cyclospora cayetanensis TaxID=88456 RepID=A0A6P6S279_9EIME|nr:uncharacterized protein LOC34620040 [Cyclospora cayetanensis]
MRRPALFRFVRQLLRAAASRFAGPSNAQPTEGLLSEFVSPHAQASAPPGQPRGSTCLASRTAQPTPFKKLAQEACRPRLCAPVAAARCARGPLPAPPPTQLRGGVRRRISVEPFRNLPRSSSLQQAAPPWAPQAFPLDPRIHFALNFGTPRPRLRIYHPEILDVCGCLRFMAVGIGGSACSLCCTAADTDPKNFQFADGGRSLRLSQLLETFQGDFGSTQREAIAYLLPFLNGSESEMLRQLLQMEGPRSSRGSSGGIAEAVVGGFLRLFGGLKVSYSPVDWQSPFLPHKPFDSRGHIL